VEFALGVILLVGVVAFVVMRPLVRGADQERGQDDRRAALEEAKEAKYREIRDAELDYRMGKVSEQDWRATDGELRAQAIAILRELDALEGAERG
jgi:membrane protein implicated in regulation of membrane protease activity